MANVPCTLVLKSTDTSMVTPDSVYVAAKQMFKFGVRIIEKRENVVMVKLSYTPRADTMLKKLGNLPIVHLKLPTEDNNELQILQKLYQGYTFNLKGDEGESLQMVKDDTKDRVMVSIGRETDKIVTQQPQTSGKRMINQVNSVSAKTMENEGKCNKKKKMKTLKNRMIKTCWCSSSNRNRHTKK
ncbi:uncharacterized protein LOC108737032 [Agrilus planipennis]|uniref:Uncharacterized protein LOC108737032 n=1 Tax=Agrilus planipennis TaxID=224129 RepID=A0A1W4WYP2_AGRPL|nr:uncharacterized protein LOC108737032 [Agrilus planipennis]